MGLGRRLPGDDINAAVQALLDNPRAVLGALEGAVGQGALEDINSASGYLEELARFALNYDCVSVADTFGEFVGHHGDKIGFATILSLGRVAPKRTVDLTTGRGYDAGDLPVRIDGEWSVNDMKQGLLGHPPQGLGSPDLHHGGQMPGGAKHEIIPSQHRNNPPLHSNRSNQGVTPEMRQSDRQLHWWYRAREQGAD